MELSVRKLRAMTSLCFGQALIELKKSKKAKITRKAWIGTSSMPMVMTQRPTKTSKMTKPYLYMEKIEKDTVARFPLDLSCESILADDWIIIK